jgi:long-chain acyl-CoA synthetase
MEPGQTGEIWFRSPQTAKGYWKLPAATQNTFRDDGWYRTGDIGFVSDGFIYISDRLDDMIVSGGENIYPAEIERVLTEHDHVAEAVAFGVPHPVWGETVHAVVVRTADGDVDEATLVTFTRDRLAHFKCPKSLTFAEVLPRNPSGKIQRAVLRKPYWQGQSRRAV